jgi:hypothetical protein
MTGDEVTEASPNDAESDWANEIAETAAHLAWTLTSVWQAQMRSYSDDDEEQKDDPEYYPTTRDLRGDGNGTN